MAAERRLFKQIATLIIMTGFVAFVFALLVCKA
jgi:hypothetical protein